jgi:hypothetical protein
MTPPLGNLARNVSSASEKAKVAFKGNPNMLPVPKPNTAKDNYGWNAGPKEISTKEIGEALTGREVSRESFIDGKSRERQLIEQTEDLIARLERVGIAGTNEGRETMVVGLVSGQTDTIRPFRNCNMLPAPQSRNVHDMLKSIRYLFDVTKSGRLRMLVVSGGWTPLPDYRCCHKAHTRRMSKFASHPTLKAYGIDIEFYNVENTIKRDESGAAMLNMHSHVLFKCRRHLGSKRWKEFLEFARNFFPKGYVHDSKIEKPNEVVKYVFKPQEFDLLSDEELGELFLQIAGGRPKFNPDTGEIEMRPGDDGRWVEVREKGLKFYHPLGSLRAFRRTLRENRQKLIMVPTVDDRWIWRVTEKKDAEAQPKPSDSLPEDNRVLAITRPMPKFTRRMEPCVIVQNYNGDFEDLIRRNRLQDRVVDARALFRARIEADRMAASAAGRDSDESRAPMKHTTTTTVREAAEKSPPNYGPATFQYGGWRQ